MAKLRRPGTRSLNDFLKYRHLWEEAGGVFIHYTSAEQALRELQEVLDEQPVSIPAKSL